MEKNSTWGGARKGSGRKSKDIKKGFINKTVTFSEEELYLVENIMLYRKEKTFSKCIKNLIKEELEKINKD